MKRAALLLRCSTNIQDYNRQKLELEKVASRFKLKVAKVFGEHVTTNRNAYLVYCWVTVRLMQLVEHSFLM